MPRSGEQNSHPQSMMDDLQTRLADHRHNLKSGGVNATGDLPDTASTQSSQYLDSEVRKKFEALAAEYERTQSRRSRARIALKLAKEGFKHKDDLMQMLVGVAGVGPTSTVPVASMGVDDQDTESPIDNDDETQPFPYNTDENETPDQEAPEDDETGEEFGEFESEDVDPDGDGISSLLEFISDIFG